MRVLLWNTEKAIDGHRTPLIMKRVHHSNIFALAFDVHNEKLLSGGKATALFLRFS